jgi:CHAD domain-containing protein
LKHRERVTRRLGPRFEKALSALDKGDAAAPRWLESATHDDLRAGLTKSYRRARKAFQRVSTRPSIEGFHRLRRRSRDLALQLELFGAGLPGKPTGAKDRFDAIGHRLGREREVMLLLNYLRRPSSAAGVARSALLRLKRDLGAERARLRDKALASSAKALRRKKRKFAALLSLT